MRPLTAVNRFSVSLAEVYSGLGLTLVALYVSVKVAGSKKMTYKTKTMQLASKACCGQLYKFRILDDIINWQDIQFVLVC